MKVRQSGCDYVSLWVKWPPKSDAAVGWRPKGQIYTLTKTITQSLLFPWIVLAQIIHFDFCTLKEIQNKTKQKKLNLDNVMHFRMKLNIKLEKFSALFPCRCFYWSVPVTEACF